MQLQLFDINDYGIKSGQRVQSPHGEKYTLLLDVGGQWWALGDYGQFTGCDLDYAFNELGFISIEE